MYLNNNAQFKFQQFVGTSNKTWRPLLYLNFYRLMLAAIFMVLFIFKPVDSIIGKQSPDLFIIVNSIYLLVGIASSITIQFRWASFNTLVHALTFADIAALTLLMHCSGGIASGLGMLIIVAIAGSSLITEGRTAYLFAAMAAIAILSEQAFLYISRASNADYTQAGFLGIALFATATLSHVLSKRLHETEAIAVQQGIDLENLAQLNEHVINHLQSGLIVVDVNNHIHLINDSAWQLFNLPIKQNLTDVTLDSISQELYSQLVTWRIDKSTTPDVIKSIKNNTEILPHYTNLGSNEKMGTLIFLEDATRIAHTAQQMKLASLGRLTASIAHEIRNPLGAISHAEQLLAESDHLDDSDKRLTEIIHNNSDRVNAIINNVMQLSRRGNTLPEEINLRTWLESFSNDFLLSVDANSDDILIDVTPAETTIFMDSSQLHQVMWNLCQNGYRYSVNAANSPKLEIIGSISKESEQTILDIVDHGTGIDPETAETIFEPFFTTEKSGSGLGLYISRELCESNHAHLSYIPVATGGSCFRIEFALTQAA